MSMTGSLPPTLQQRLSEVARQVRRVHLLRGISLLVILLALLAGSAFLADYLLRESLPVVARGIFLVVWLGTGGLCLISLPRRLLQPLDDAALAAAIEAKHPELGERLTSSVELCLNSNLGNGSPELIALLVQETEARAGKLDLSTVVSGRSTAWLIGLAALAAFATVSPAVVAPAQYGRLAQRFFAPWHVPAPLPDYSFVVEPGEVYAARGRPLTISAYLTPRGDLELPPKAKLVVVGETDRLQFDMTPDAEVENRYTVALRVPGDVRYHVEAGNARSDEFALHAITPVDLAPESPTVTITPPTYAASILDGDLVTGMVDLTCLRHSDVSMEFQFTRPAVSAFLEWTDKDQQPQRIALQLSDDRRSAAYQTRAIQTGSYRLILEAEHDVLTEREGGTITVRPDLPPAVLKFSAPEGPRSARSHDRLPIEARLADDLAVAGAVFEYRVNAERVVREEQIALEVSRETLAQHVFQLAGKVKPGDEVHYRIRFFDNLPPEFAGPHVVHHPVDGWLKLRIVSDGGSLKEQDVIARRDEINKKLDDLIANLKQEQRKIMRVQAETRRENALNEQDLQQVNDAKRQNQQSEKALRDLARELTDAPGGDKLAQQALDVAKQEMRETEKALDGTVAQGASPRDRDQKFTEATEELSRAMQKLDQMKEANQQLARERLAQARIEALADRQKQLAEQAQEALNQAPTQRNEQLRREQEEIARELQRLTESNPTLRNALDEARAEQAKEAADKARELAQAQRELTQAGAETERKREAERLAELANKQEELARKVEELAKKTANPSRANLAQPFKSDDAEKAAASLKKGDTDRATREQEATARELDRLANDLQRGAEQGKDPKMAARQLARIEDNLSQRLRDERIRGDEEKLSEIKREHRAVREAAEKLSIPPNRAEIQAEKQKATEALVQAEEALEKQNADEARQAMDQARQALRELSNKLPSLQERQEKARRELSKLAREQEESARIARDASKLPEAARRQEEIARGLENLDAPGAESRRDRARDAAAKAGENLQERNRGEAAENLARAQREIERLGQALQGRQTEDEKAADLARRQQELADDAAKPEPSPAKQAEMRRNQQQIAEQTRGINSKEYGWSKARAEQSTQKAVEEANRRGPTSPESQKAMSEAAERLKELARKMGAEQTRPEENNSTLPSKEQAEAARKLAQEQRELRDAVQRSREELRAERQADSNAGNDPAESLAREQREIARQAERLADDVNREQGEKSTPSQRAGEAGQSAGDAARGMESGALEKAQKAGERAAQQMRQLANELAKTPRGGDSNNDTLEQARKLAQRQESLNQQAQEIAGNRSAQRARQQARQEELRRQANELMRELGEMGRTGPEASRGDAQEAARAAGQAETMMQAARGQSRMGNQSGTQTQREMAANSLEKAARHAEQLARSSESSTPSGQAGQAMRQARGAMQRAREAMQRNQPSEAGPAMQQAAGNLDRAAQQLERAMQPTMPSNPGERGAPGGGEVDARMLPQELAEYSGKKWGELPGEVQSQISQQMKARYGEDYARMIKLYFEQIADTKKRK